MIDDITFVKHSLVNACAEVTAVDDDDDAFDIKITHTVPERTTGENIDISTSIRVYLPERIITVLRHVTDTVISLMTHEVYEGLHFNGQRIFDPHVTVTGNR